MKISSSGTLYKIMWTKTGKNVRGFSTFEDTPAWNRAKQLTASIYRVTSTSSFNHDFDLKRQMRRSAVSVMSNIAEGYERKGDREYAHFLSIAKGSCGELRSLLHVTRDQDFIDCCEFERLKTATIELSRIIGGLMKKISSDLKPKGR